MPRHFGMLLTGPRLKDFTEINSTRNHITWAVSLCITHDTAFALLATVLNTAL